MVATATLVGALFGAGVQFYSNAVRKLPAMRGECKHQNQKVYTVKIFRETLVKISDEIPLCAVCHMFVRVGGFLKSLLIMELKPSRL